MKNDEEDTKPGKNRTFPGKENGQSNNKRTYQHPSESLDDPSTSVSKSRSNSQDNRKGEHKKIFDHYGKIPYKKVQAKDISMVQTFEDISASESTDAPRQEQFLTFPLEERYLFADLYGNKSQEILLYSGSPTPLVRVIEKQCASTSTDQKYMFQHSDCYPEEEEELNTLTDIHVKQGEEIKDLTCYETFLEETNFLDQDIMTEDMESDILEDEHFQWTVEDIQAQRSELSKTRTQQEATPYLETREKGYAMDEEEYKKSDVIVYCGGCGVAIDDFKVLFPNLVQKRIQNGDSIRQKYHYKCSICQVVKCRKILIETHIIDHILRKELKCLECQKEINSEEELYCLESEAKELKSKDYRCDLDSKTKAAITNLSIHCNNCNKLLGEASDLLMRMYELNREEIKQTAKIIVLSCFICGGSTPKMGIIQNHILHHLCNKQLICKQCSDKGYEGFIKMLTNDKTNIGGYILRPVSPEGDKIGSLPSIDCENCGMYLGESRILIQSLKPERKPVLFQENIYTCMLCHKQDSRESIENHILEHINHISCELCQFINDLDVSLTKVPHTVKKLVIPQLLATPVICGKCHHTFSNARDTLPHLYNKYMLKRKNGEKIQLNHCLQCRNTYVDNIRSFRAHVLNHIFERELFCPKCKLDMRS